MGSNVVPDVVWINHERLVTLMDEAGHHTGASELVVEVLSPGGENERRGREAKLKLTSRAVYGNIRSSIGAYSRSKSTGATRRCCDWSLRCLPRTS